MCIFVAMLLAGFEVQSSMPCIACNANTQGLLISINTLSSVERK